MQAPRDLADIAADILARIRRRAPRVHCVTNAVAQAYTANLLLAAGAVPSMTIAPEEVAAFVAGADALLVNLGTFDAERRAAIDLALGAIGRGGPSDTPNTPIPWVLDPVFIDRSLARADYARALLRCGPTVVRLNQREFAALSGADADAGAPVRFAKTYTTAVAVTGDQDIVADGARTAVVGNGDALMGLVTAMGCAGSALICAALAVERDAWLAAVAALVTLGVAGEVAARGVGGPGSFSTAILDALYNLDGATLRAHTKVS